MKRSLSPPVRRPFTASTPRRAATLLPHAALAALLATALSAVPALARQAPAPAADLPGATDARPYAGAAATPEARSLVAELIAEVNAARAGAGAPPLRVHPALERAAMSHSADMAARRELDHSSPVPGRSTPRERIRAEGVSPRATGENIAIAIHRAAGVARSTVDRWLASPGHRENLLDPAFTVTGIGAARASDGDWYITNLFAASVK